MSWRQHQQVLAPGGLPTCPGTNTSMFWRQNQTSACLGDVLATAPGSLGTNTSIAQHQAPACLGTNSRHQHHHVLATARSLPSISWNEQERVLATAPGNLPSMSLAASSACLGTNTNISWRQSQHVLATAPGGLPMSWHETLHVFASMSCRACLGTNTCMSWQQHQAASPACLDTNTSMS